MYINMYNKRLFVNGCVIMNLSVNLFNWYLCLVVEKNITKFLRYDFDLIYGNINELENLDD